MCWKTCRRRYGIHESLTPSTDTANQKHPQPSAHFIPSPTVSHWQAGLAAARSPWACLHAYLVTQRGSLQRAEKRAHWPCCLLLKCLQDCGIRISRGEQFVPWSFFRELGMSWKPSNRDNQQGIFWDSERSTRRRCSRLGLKAGQAPGVPVLAEAFQRSCFPLFISVLKRFLALAEDVIAVLEGSSKSIALAEKNLWVQNCTH